MNYETIILELLSRVQSLETEVEMIKNLVSSSDSPSRVVTNGQTFTEVARNFIIEQKCAAKERGEDRIVLRAGDIEKAIGLKNRTMIVCNAMKQLMSGSDRIVEAPPSGVSTTVKVEYVL